MTQVTTFYRFVRLADIAGLAAALRMVSADHDLTGTIILASEGINGTVAGKADGLGALKQHLLNIAGLSAMPFRDCPAHGPAFGRLKIKVKPEIVTFGQTVDTARRTGTRVAPANWNAVLADPGVAVIDTRNGLEVAVGSFAGAIDPGTAAFSDFPAWWAAHAAELAGKKIAMFCTGGIRCEKASGWLLGQGLAEVLQLQGGILAYLAVVPPDQSLWRGACFVFDERGAVGHGLVPQG